jgi:BirA family transcriptional regulator, biotin operon repressor / biotin---[acetyl-CoA-carboxylase] ligase
MNSFAANQLDGRRISEQLKCNSLVRKIRVLDHVDSTNDHVMRLARRAGKADIVVFAEYQSAGRGRFGRHWQSASGEGLWFSLLMQPKLPLQHWPRLTTWAAVSVADAVESVVPTAHPQIKWPNDVCLCGRKVCGILVETFIAEPRRFAVVGIGLNVNQSEFPEPLARTAISLRQFSNTTIDRETLAAAILNGLATHEKYLLRDFDALLRMATKRSSLIGRAIKAQIEGRLIEGTAECLIEDGALQMRTSIGEEIRLATGEVTLSPAL